MNIKIKKNWEIKENKVTDEKVFLTRRNVVKGLTTTAVAGLLGPSLLSAAPSLKKLKTTPNSKYNLGNITEEKLFTSYNNFYEFALDKQTVKNKAKRLLPRPWSVKISGLVNKPKIWDIEDILKKFPLEERK